MKLNFKKYGSGNPVVIVHGLLGMLDNWVEIAKILAEHFMVFIIDLRNHGRSPHSNKFNYSIMARDLEEFFIDNGIYNPILIGHSMGGKVCIKLAFENQKLLKKIIIVDICQKEYPVNKEIVNMFKVIMSIKMESLKSFNDVESQLESFEIKDESKHLIIKNIKKDKGIMQWKSNIEYIQNNLEFIRAAIVSEKKVLIPTLFLRGQNSNFILSSDFNNIYRNFPNAKIVTISESGHWIHADNREMFLKEVLDFLKQ